MRTPVLIGFCEDLLGTPMEVVLAPPSELVSDTLVGQMGALRPRLLQAGPPVLDLVALVVEVVSVPNELSCAGHGDVVVNVTIHAKDSRILGSLRTTRVKLPFHRHVQVELIGFTIALDGAGGKLVIVIQQVLAVRCVFTIVG